MCKFSFTIKIGRFQEFAQIKPNLPKFGAILGTFVPDSEKGTKKFDSSSKISLECVEIMRPVYIKVSNTLDYKYNNSQTEETHMIHFYNPLL